MNEYEEKKGTSGGELSNKSIGQIMIENEEKQPEIREFNIQLIKTMRAFLIKSPPILTQQLELGNLRMNNNNNFIYSDFEEYMGKYHFEDDAPSHTIH